MPASSKKQFKFMAMVASGKKKVKDLPSSKAQEFLTGVNYKKLPVKKKSK